MRRNNFRLLKGLTLWLLFFMAPIKLFSQEVKKDLITTKTAVHIDSTLGYQVVIPDWLELNENPLNGFWGGGFPAVGGVSNALYIKGFDKSKFDSFEKFVEVYITGNKFGKTTLYSKNHKWYGYNPRDLKKVNNGITCRVFTFFQNNIYHHQFVLLESKTSYIWIQFTATPDTYDVNLPRFNEFMEGLKLL